MDNATFGAFTDAFLTSFRDEISKLPSLVFPILSNAVPGHIDVDSVSLIVASPATGPDAFGRWWVSERP